MAAFVTLLRRGRPASNLNLGRLLPDLAPYLVILLLVLATRLVSPLQQSLSGVALTWSLDERFGGTFQPLYHPGTMLFLGFFVGALVTGRSNLIAEAMASALRRLLPVALALFVMLALSRFMVPLGDAAALVSAASGVGAAWPLIAPLIGVLGTFITPRRTSSSANSSSPLLQASRSHGVRWPRRSET